MRPVCPFLSLVQHRPVDSQTVEYSGAIYRLTDSFNFKQKAIDTVTHVSAIYEYKKKVLAVPPRPERNWKSLFNKKSKKKRKIFIPKTQYNGECYGPRRWISRWRMGDRRSRKGPRLLFGTHTWSLLSFSLIENQPCKGDCIRNMEWKRFFSDVTLLPAISFSPRQQQLHRPHRPPLFILLRF